MPIDKLMQVEQVLQQFPAGGEGRRDKLNQRLGIVGRDVLVRERGTERTRVRRDRDVPVGRDAQRLALQPTAAAGQQLLLAAVTQRRQPPLE